MNETDLRDTGFPGPEPHHAASPTATVLTELQLYGYLPFQEEPDPRPLPEEGVVRTALADIFDAPVSALSDTRLEPDLEDLLWSSVNLFHRAADRASANSTPTSRRRSAARSGRTARKSARSSWSGCWPRASP